MSMKTSHVALVAAILLGLIAAESLPAILVSNNGDAQVEMTSDQLPTQEELQAVRVATSEDADLMEAVWPPAEFDDVGDREPYKRSDKSVDPFWMTSR